MSKDCCIYRATFTCKYDQSWIIWKFFEGLGLTLISLNHKANSRTSSGASCSEEKPSQSFLLSLTGLHVHVTVFILLYFSAWQSSFYSLHVHVSCWLLHGRGLTCKALFFWGNLRHGFVTSMICIVFWDWMLWRQVLHIYTSFELTYSFFEIEVDIYLLFIYLQVLFKK